MGLNNVDSRFFGITFKRFSMIFIKKKNRAMFHIFHKNIKVIYNDIQL